MAASIKFFGKALNALFNKEIDWNETDKIKVMLCSSSYSPDQDTHDYKDDVSNEVTGTGYTAGGAALANPTLTYTGATNTFVLDGDDVVWATSTITARYGVIYYNSGTDSTSPLIGYIDFGADVSSSGGDFTITFNANGIMGFVVA